MPARSAISPRSDLWIVLALTVATGALNAAPFAWSRTLYGDTLAIYSFFSDNLDSLMRFGEPAWWLPQVNGGVPGYFYGLLGQANLGRPSFVLIACVAWLLAKAGVTLPSVQPLYVLHFGFLIPGLFLVGVRAVAMRVFRTRAAVLYALAVAAFSPGVLVNLADPGILENTAYALFVVAAFLGFVARPSRAGFAWLLATSLLFAVAPSQMLIAAAAPVLLAVAASVLAFSRPARRALATVTPAQWLLAVVLGAVAVLPSALAYRQQNGRVTHAAVGDLHYAYGELKSGNPLQFLVGSVPGLAFAWDEYRQQAEGPRSQYEARPLLEGGETGANYLGLLAAPLAAVGFVAGRRRVRVPLFAAAVASAAIFLMYGASPVFAPLLVAVPALRSLNHFGDMLYPGGAFLLVLFAAALGLETIERRRDLAERLAKAFPIWSVVGLAAYLRWADPSAALFGFAALMSAAFAIALLWARRVPRRTRARQLGASIVLLTLLDVSTVGFWYARAVQGSGERLDESSFGRSLGMTDPAAKGIASFYMLRDAKALADAGVPIDRIPRIAAFCAATPAQDALGPDSFAAAFEGPIAGRRLPLAPEPEAEASLARFFAAPGGAVCSAQVRPTGGTYNEIRLVANAAQPALLFLRNGYAHEWQAWVNGAPAPLHRAFAAYAAVEIPAGDARVVLRYRPPGVLVSLGLAYAVVIGVWIWALRIGHAAHGAAESSRS